MATDPSPSPEGPLSDEQIVNGVDQLVSSRDRTHTVNVSFQESFIYGLRRNALLYVVLIVLVMTIAAFWVAIEGVAQNRDQNIRLGAQVECQNRYNQINNERTRQLAIATDAERIAEDKSDVALAAFVNGVEQGQSDDVMRERLRTLNAALKEQQGKRALTEQERKEHPVPPPPQALCGPNGK